MNEKQKKDILAAELDTDQLEKISGGINEFYDEDIIEAEYNCISDQYRKKDQGCAATVEAGSHCLSNDACILISVYYE